MARHEHWDRVHAKKKPSETNWYQPRLTLSLELIEQAELPRSAGILDVGAGTSTLAGDLLDQGFNDLSVLDCSAAAIELARSQLGSRSEQVQWLHGDVTQLPLPASRFDLWHDRAVFHFLTELSDREAYRASLELALRAGGSLIMATFALAGPERCSGLPVIRYDAEALQRELGPGFRLLTSTTESHRTPSGNRQEFLYCRLRTNS
jgi:SAM-dependent methyltransferase